jgi:hypothetical protein
VKHTASIIAHSFDCLPAHIQVSARGVGSRPRVAIQNAVGLLFTSHDLKRKRIGSFKVSVVLTKEEKNETTKT